MPQNPPSRTAPPPPAPGFSLEDIYYTLFRHKGKILVLSAAGIIAALVLFMVKKPGYISEAKVMILYVLESTTMAPNAGEAQMKPADSRGENIMTSELEIMTSLDLCLQVADAVGPEKILARSGGGTNRYAAANLVKAGLIADVPRRGNVIRVLFGHPDPEIPKLVLQQVIELYLKRHLEIHQGLGVVDEFLTRQADQIRTRLVQTEDDLKKLRNSTRIWSLPDMKEVYISEMSKIQQGLLSAEGELGERRAAVDAFQKQSGTNAPAEAPAAPVSPETIEHYREIRSQLDEFKKQKQALLVQSTEEHPRVRSLQQQITTAETERKKLEADNPTLAILAAGTNTFDLPTEIERVNGIVFKIKVLNEQLERVRTEAMRLVDAEPEITQLMRKREVDEGKFRYYSTHLEQARERESLGNGKVTNISIVQAPSPASMDTQKLVKPLLGVLAGGILGGLALAFLLDRVLDPSVKRVTDIDRHTALPVFLSVPDTNWKGGFHFPKLRRNGRHRRLPAPEAPSANGSAAEAPPVPALALVPWDAHHALKPYFEALRDRLMTYFEVRNMTHKPKLVGVTSCHRGAGVTSLAAGLAASLSETGDGYVLLVDMNVERGAAFPFHGGKPGCGLSEALESDKPETAFVQEKLYIVSAHETNSDLPRILPKRFAHLIPKMKASDYDYIIFDMPPVTQTSVTPRLSSFMDVVLMVVESEKTGQEILKRATGLLRESGASAAAILNKSRRYIPARLSQEL